MTTLFARIRIVVVAIAVLVVAAIATPASAQQQVNPTASAVQEEQLLQQLQRVLLAPADDERVGALASKLFACATVTGAASIGAPGGSLEPGRAADFFTVDLNDPAIAGASDDDLLSAIVFSSSRAAVRDVVVGGKQVVAEGCHAAQEQIIERFGALQKRFSRG